MHTSSVTLSRLTFTNITNPDALKTLADLLGLETTENYNQLDFIQEEGSMLMSDEAVNILFEAFLADATGNVDTDTLAWRVEQINRNGFKKGYVAHTRIFNKDYLVNNQEIEIDPVELFDLIKSVQDGYNLEHIVTQWSCSSNKCQPDAHAGGSLITTDGFTIRGVMGFREMETIANTYVMHGPAKAGTYYVNKFITPTMDMHTIKSPELHRSVQRALLQELLIEMELSDVKEIMNLSNQSR